MSGAFGATLSVRQRSRFVMPRDSEGRMDPMVATDVLVKVQSEDPLVSTPDVCFVAKDDYCTARMAREVVSSRFFQRFILPRDFDGMVPSEILEPILAEVKVEEVQVTESSLEE